MADSNNRTPRIDLSSARALVAAALAAADALAAGDDEPAGGVVGTTARVWTEADSTEVRALPGGVTAFAWLTDGRDRWLWCETVADPFGIGQAVIDFPAGRFLTDSLDTRTHYVYVGARTRRC